MSDSDSIKTPDQEPLRVVVGLLFDEDQRVLVQQRTHPVQLAGLWEFPGGKIEAQESVHDALVRELNEELDVVVETSIPFMRVQHEYPERTVVLEVCEAIAWSGAPASVEGQAFKWEHPAQLHDYAMLEANTVMVDALIRRAAAREKLNA